jgi:hypothetical protein
MDALKGYWAAANTPGSLYNTFLYLKQVLGNLAHISFVIL